MYSSEELEHFDKLRTLQACLSFATLRYCMQYSSPQGLYRNGLLLQSINDRLMFD